MSERHAAPWETSTLGELANITMGQSPPSSTYNSSRQGLPFYQGTADFGANTPIATTWCSAPLKIAKRGSILVSVRAPVGETNWNPVDSCIGRGLAAITAAKLDPVFLRFLMRWIKPRFQRVAQGSTFDAINGSEISALEVSTPPLAEQKKIAEILSSVDEVIENTESEINKLEDLKKATLNELLTKGIGHTEFKESEIGRIPKSWDVSELSEVAEKQYGIVDGPFGSNLKSIHYRPSGVPVIQSGFVTSLVFKADAYVYVDQAKFDEQKRSSVSGGDIVMAKIGANAGASAMLPIGHKTGLLAGNCLKIAVDRKKADPRYVQQYLSWLYQIGEISRVRTVTAQPAISLSSLRKLLIPRPPIDEQEKIVEVTESISCNGWKAREKYDSIICLRSALMQDLLTGKVRVKVN